MLTFVIPASTAFVRFSSATPDEPCRTKWRRHCVADFANELKVEDGITRRHRVRTPDSDGEGVHAGRCHESRGLLRVGADTRRVNSVLAANFSKLSFDTDTALVAVRGQLGRQRDVRVVVERRAVEHDGREAEVDCFVNEFDGLRVVEVDGDRELRGAGDRQRCEGDRFGLPWYLTAFSLICKITGAFASAAPAVSASASSIWMTLKAPAPRRCGCCIHDCVC